MKSAAPSIHPLVHIFCPIRYFFKDSRSGGIILILCTVLSLVLSNGSFINVHYASFWEKVLLSPPASIHLPTTNRDLINDVLMTFFFLFVGMEIKRELTIGELASVKKCLLPVLAALGGMICPALFFYFFNGNTPFHQGWGIPMATDIAFSLGVLSLLGKRVPVQLKIFLAALAIIDDLGAVVTIAIFYTSKLNLAYLSMGLITFSSVWLMNWLKVKRTIHYILPAIILWYCLFNSGIHATIAGVLMAFSLPLSKLSRIERVLHYPVNFVIMPLFALANTAILLPAQLDTAFTSTISFGVMAGLVFGKPIGIFLFSFLAVKAGIASLPFKTSFKQLWGIGILGGIGFTMSIFTTSLAYNQESLQVISKVSVIAASMASGVIGYSYLFLLKPKSSAIAALDHVKESENSYLPLYQTQPAIG
ncbi:MAG: Na+/H+ antiporter NhaA [Bacteroidota bacterium]|nr:Na+/H+ antiporter NhaA [Bacteroidota bacterium]